MALARHVHGWSAGSSLIYQAALGDVTFTASTGHDTVISYEARVRASGTSTPVLATKDLGKPAPNSRGTCLVNLAAVLNSLDAGDYEVTVAATDAGGTTDSAVSNAFTVPLT